MDPVSFRDIKGPEIAEERLVAQCVSELNATDTRKRIKWRISCLLKCSHFHESVCVCAFRMHVDTLVWVAVHI